MRGQVLGVDRASAEGQIAGADGERYTFRPEDWSDRVGPAIGAAVDFQVDGTRALKIYHIPPVAPSGHRSPAQVETNGRNRYVAALLAFAIGTLGVHRFYTGRTGSGVVMLVASMSVIGLFVTVPWALVDMIRYLTMSDADFAARYPCRIAG